MAGRHTRKASDPHEAIRAPPVAKLPHHRHAHSFLRLDEMAVEQIDQDVTLTRLEGVLAQFEHGTAIRLG